MRVALLPTCVVDAVEPGVGIAAVELLERAGHEVVIPDAATCCGQPAWNAGHAGPAAQVARTTLHALAGTDADAVVVPAGSCTAMLRVFWAELFRLAGSEAERRLASEVASRTRELTEFLDEVGPPTATTARTTATTEDPPATVLHRSCHMLRELRVVDPPDRLLDATGAERRTSGAEERCCGFGGLFSVALPEVSTAMADEVLDAALAAGAARLVGCDASCLVHLRSRAEHRGLPLDVAHLAEVLERATRPGTPGRHPGHAGPPAGGPHPDAAAP